ncbi:MAG: EVE domain-containing protein [Bacteroidales bacterium]|nr:EVE domain-containing protein [Bacteroidales bacterium]
MNHWLIKFAPFRYSWNDCLKYGKFEMYSVRNHQARNHLREMKKGDEALFYHSQQGNCVMGRMKVIQETHQDPTTSDPQWVSVTFEPVETFVHPVSLAEIKREPGLTGIGLIRQPRLAVVKLSKVEFDIVVALGTTTIV